ncbi:MULTISPECIES: hypothetical protein [Nocardia]|uniref:Uncharacterized protein n=2 Tax=Nocardia TaxID=1817 RepID=K0EUS2_NOCB7|nr:MULTISPECIES: hypothetical protein [Nocardia]AFU00834.1 hypothetical protein O3I_014365 [Nocardia brasiliensis ATCC 700358]ASF08450.1 hypothetical protein CEQ30_14965 [Nocardia brasiliensis]KIA63899.1 hypothetical protein FG87_16070 [Nocardia vulneris]MBF6131361.1 hypothetical protein [Nocardia brasiliensis]MBF6547913.1 hypothetical protein [Nocardia brasiliensis]
MSAFISIMDSVNIIAAGSGSSDDSSSLSSSTGSSGGGSIGDSIDLLKLSLKLLSSIVGHLS